MLRNYQKECLEKCIESIDGGLSVLPTGSGKSHIIAELCHHYHDRKVLVVTPRLELNKQNQSKIKSNATCVTVNKAHFRRLSSDILIIDEAHLVRKNDGMYRGLIKRSNISYGFTATPFRLDSGHIVPYIFDKIIYEISREALIKEKYLITRNIVKVPLDSLINVKQSSFTNIKRMSKDVCPYTERCVEVFTEAIKDEQGLIFACDVEHAFKIKDLIGESDVIHGKLNKETRLQLITAFKEGKLQYLINCEILTTGFDYPALRNIVLLRPTDSYTLYEQMCGRGDRIYHDKHLNNIYDFTVNSYQFGNCNKSLKTNFHKHCIFCHEITDYRLKKCLHCTKVLVRGEPPKKKCPQCDHKNYNTSTYCKECGYFIKKNVTRIDFDCIKWKHVGKGTYLVYFGDSIVRFYTEANNFNNLIDMLNVKSNHDKKVTLNKSYSLFYKWDNYSKRAKIIQILLD